MFITTKPAFFPTEEAPTLAGVLGERHRAIVSNEVSLLKAKVRDRHPDSDLTQGQVVTMLESLERTINSQILMRRIYLAAPFEWIDRMKDYAQQLRSLGFEVTSSWLDEQDRGTETDLTDAEGCTQLDKLDMLLSYAARDIRNILASDTIIEFNPGKALIRNTRLTELGGAFFLGKQCIVIGPENPKHKNRIDTIFSLLSEGTIPDDLSTIGIKPMKHFNTWDDFLCSITQKTT